MIFGKKDGHVPAEGRDLIRKRMGEKGVRFSWLELEGAQREFVCLIHLCYQLRSWALHEPLG